MKRNNLLILILILTIVWSIAATSRLISVDLENKALEAEHRLMQSTIESYEMQLDTLPETTITVINELRQENFDLNNTNLLMQSTIDSYEMQLENAKDE